jgi:hypothetical protein
VPVHRLQAIERVLEDQTHWSGKLIYFQVGAGRALARLHAACCFVCTGAWVRVCLDGCMSHGCMSPSWRRAVPPYSAPSLQSSPFARGAKMCRYDSGETHTAQHAAYSSHRTPRSRRHAACTAHHAACDAPSRWPCRRARTTRCTKWCARPSTTSSAASTGSTRPSASCPCGPRQCCAAPPRVPGVPC